MCEGKRVFGHIDPEKGIVSQEIFRDEIVVDPCEPLVRHTSEFIGIELQRERAVKYLFIVIGIDEQSHQLAAWSGFLLIHCPRDANTAITKELILHHLSHTNQLKRSRGSSNDGDHVLVIRCQVFSNRIDIW
jgi:hypothetical protein